MAWIVRRRSSVSSSHHSRDATQISFRFADSLNLSVAAALCCLQLFHMDPHLGCDMSEEEKHELRAEWFPRLMAQRTGTSAQ